MACQFVQARECPPFRRPNVGSAQGASGMDATRGLMGQGWPMQADPGAVPE
jgi:hypothetical protein